MNHTKQHYNQKEKKGYTNKKEYPQKKQMKNDPSWYTRFPALAESAGSIFYGQRQGDALDFPGIPAAVPGIMKISLLPTIGISKDGNSSVNNMSRLTYAFTRHANNGSRNYEAPDYMTYFLAMGSAYAFYSSICRVYGLLRTYSVTNNYVNKAMVQALNFNFDDLVSNMANLRYYINFFATRINSFAVPKDFTYYDRTAYVPLHVFKDNETDKCSFYILDYASLFIWDGTSSGGSSLRAVDWGNTQNKDLSDIKAMGDQILDALFKNEDIGIMSGDTLKAFGSAKLREIAAIPSDWDTVPIYDHDMLWQIHNTRVYNIASVIQNTDVTQQNGVLIYNPTITGYSGVKLQGKGLLIDSDKDSPDYVFNFENTRLTPILTADDSAIDSCGTELPIKAEIYVYTDNSSSGMELVALPYGDFDVNTLQSAIDGTLGASTFKLHPIVYFQISGDDSVIATTPYGDLNNYTQISRLALKQMHDAATLSEFSVPNIASAAK